MANNFLQVGRTNQCSNCHPEKLFFSCDLVFKEHGIKCNCICHDPKVKDISAWINEGKKYQFFDFIDDKMLIKFRQESRIYPKFSKSTQINPLKQRVYKRLESLKLKDLGDKINQLVDELNQK